MTKEELFLLGTEAGFADYDITLNFPKQFKRFAELVADHERAAIRSAQQSEPVAWMHTSAAGDRYFRKKPHDKVFNPQPVYIQPQREALTNDEIKDLIMKILGFGWLDKESRETAIDIVRGVERAHGIGGQQC